MAYYRAHRNNACLAMASTNDYANKTGRFVGTIKRARFLSCGPENSIRLSRLKHVCRKTTMVQFFNAWVE